MLREATMNEQYKDWSNVPAVLTIEEVSQLLRIHIQTVRLMIKDGRLPAWKAGRQWRISKDTIKNLLEDS